MRFIIAITLGVLVLGLHSCKKDSADPIDTVSCENPEIVSYSADIVPLLDSSCAYSGCHTAGFTSGDFTAYEGVAEKAMGGSLLARVVNVQDMPPTYAPENKPQELSTCDIELFNSWIEAGFPDN